MAAAPAVDAPSPPLITRDRLRAATLIGAAGLLGFGLILFIAANWDAIGRFERFGLVGSVIIAGGLAALVAPALTTPGLLLAFAGTGGMLALIGQTYQTGADAWQLFALWAGLTLPWVLGARSDALWTPWAIVAMTGIALWHATFGPLVAPMFGPGPVPSALPSLLGVQLTMVATWAMSLGVTAAMGPWERIEPWLGSRQWAFRIGLILTLTLIASHAIEAMIGFRGTNGGAYVMALACLAGIAAVLAFAMQRDMLLLAATALAIDVVLIAGAARMLTTGGRTFQTASFVMIGLIAAGIVAASVVALMWITQLDGNGAAPAAKDAAAKTQPTAQSLARATGGAARPWPIVVLSGLGAILAALPFLVALWIFLGPALRKGPAIYVAAAIALPVSVFAIRRARGLFLEQVAMVGFVAGMMLLVWGFFRDLPGGAAGLALAALALGLALSLGRAWLAALLGAAATAGVAIALIEAFAIARSPALHAIAWSTIALAGVAAMHLLHAHRDWLAPMGQAISLDTTGEATASGWLAAALAGLALSSGSTFLLAAHFGGGGFGSGTVAPAAIMMARAVSGALAVGACLWLARAMPSVRSPLAATAMATTVGLALAMPTLGAVALVLAFAITGGRRVIGLAAAVAALWIAGAFYYTLALPLTHKAAILMAAGAVLGVAALASGARLGLGATTSTPSVMGPAVMGPAVVRALAAFGLLAAGGVSAEAIRSKEALIRDGAPMFIELAPVDPRSLMQGDFMALRFQIPDSGLRHHNPFGPRPLAIGKRDGNGVVRLTRLGDATTALTDDETRIELTPKKGRWMVVTDAWFFKEGTAKKWEAARFGEFRVLPDGRALLVGLADKDRAAIK